MRDNDHATRDQDGETRETPISVEPSLSSGTGGGCPKLHNEPVTQNATPTALSPIRTRSSGPDQLSSQRTRNIREIDDRPAPNSTTVEKPISKTYRHSNSKKRKQGNQNNEPTNLLDIDNDTIVQ